MSDASSNSEKCDSDNDVEIKREKDGGILEGVPTPIYTKEQKIVSAVWIHERPYNYLTLEDVKNNFRIRFNLEPPSTGTMIKWERRLFSSGTLIKEKNQKPLERLIHVPYVKASLREKPNLSMTERACQLGLSQTRLKQILKYDIKTDDLNQQSERNAENPDGDKHKS